jgi:hypothetical protein
MRRRYPRRQCLIFERRALTDDEETVKGAPSAVMLTQIKGEPHTDA